MTPRRTAKREQRKLELIKSTLDTIARRGFSDTTLADVAEGAGLSTGIVNFHFQTKEALLVETLTFLADEYRSAWRRALSKAGSSPAEALHALMMCDFEPTVCNRKKIAVWQAFWGESKSRPSYMKLCGDMDQEHFDVMRDLCARIIDDGSYHTLDAALVAQGLTALTDGLWQDQLIDPANFTRETGRRICELYLTSLFPRHFPLSGSSGSATEEPRDEL